jgi:predicted enzyme related to lactoylglutathione lyase
MMPAPQLQYVAPVFAVADLARAIAYYRDRLGFALEFQYADSYAAVRRDGLPIHLKCAPQLVRAPGGDEDIEVCIAVSDADALSAEMAARGANIVVALRDVPYGREFYVRDADGHLLGFVQAR